MVEEINVKIQGPSSIQTLKAGGLMIITFIIIGAIFVLIMPLLSPEILLGFLFMLIIISMVIFAFFRDYANK